MQSNMRNFALCSPRTSSNMTTFSDIVEWLLSYRFTIIRVCYPKCYELRTDCVIVLLAFNMVRFGIVLYIGTYSWLLILQPVCRERCNVFQFRILHLLSNIIITIYGVLFLFLHAWYSGLLPYYSSEIFI